MMSYAEFVERIQELNSANEKWLHILPSIRLEHRQRYIQLLEKGMDMPKAFDLLLLTKNVSDEEFKSKLQDLS